MLRIWRLSKGWNLGLCYTSVSLLGGWLGALSWWRMHHGKLQHNNVSVPIETYSTDSTKSAAEHFTSARLNRKLLSRYDWILATFWSFLLPSWLHFSLWELKYPTQILRFFCEPKFVCDESRNCHIFMVIKKITPHTYLEPISFRDI
jgi:hypothetical protein